MTYISEPRLTRRNGMKVINGFYRTENLFVSATIISMAYDRSHAIVEKNCGEVPDEVWNKWVSDALNMLQ